MDLYGRITGKAAEKMRNAIIEAGGNEIFFRGIPDENMVVTEVEIIARGNSNSVPAVLSRMKKREVVIHNHPSGILYPSDNDISIASHYGELGGGSYIVDNDVNEIYIIVEPEAKKKIVNIDEYFVENGVISSRFPEFEYRSEQLEMAQIIEKSLNEGKKAIIEAGTGTGKTLAYLIPTVKWAIANKRKVIISTNTINLQEQLIRKDIPLLRNIIDEEFKDVLVKGRGNYLCMRKSKTLDKSDYEGFNEKYREELAKILMWAGETSWGDRQELDFEPAYFVWEKVASEGDLCIKNKCYYRDKCFFMKARREVVNADLLITNHHIYFADLAIRKGSGFVNDYAILPNYEVLVVDEAHNMEKVARDYFSVQVSRFYFSKLLNNIYNYKGEKRTIGGAVLKALNYIKENKEYLESSKKLEDLLNNTIIAEHKELYERLEDFFIKLMEIYGDPSTKAENKYRLRIEEKENEERWKKEVEPRKREIKRCYASYIRKMTEFENIIEGLEADDDYGILGDLGRYLYRLTQFMEGFNFVFELENEDHVYWLEINSKKTNIEINATPLDISKDLNETLYANLDSLVFTSATLAVGKKFDYFKKAVGLDNVGKNELIEDIIKSPFNYTKQMKVYIPLDMPDPSKKEFSNNAADIIKSLVRKTDGRTFVLFTSYSTLNYVYYQVRDELQNEGYSLFVQGEYPRHKLIDLFKSTDRAVLFGADSFWEGVDVKGDKLSSVIIVKLPFKVPTEPIVEAVIEKIKEDGGNPFMQYQIPEAVIKFKQGIGRLIRSKEDRGIITVLDPRIINKTYGKLFMDVLPLKNVKVLTCEELK